MEPRILISKGLVIDPASELEAERDIVIEAGVIKEIAPSGSVPAKNFAQVIDAKGSWVIPGLIDVHVHLREPGFEWKETVTSGVTAAVAGGFTTVCAMPNTKPTNDNENVTRYILERAAEADLARVLPIGAISRGLEGKEMAPLSELRSAGCVAFSDDGEPVYNSGLMRRALEWAKMVKLPIVCHEEDKQLSCGGCMNESGLALRLGLKGWPAVAEEVMVARDIELARTTGARVHFCHLSSARSVELVRRAKHDQISVTAEVTPHHLTLTEDAVAEYDTNAKMSPPLRSESDRLALIEGLRDGTIDAVASDHAPHDIDTKLCEFPKASFGILGLQTSLPLLIELVTKGKLKRSRAIAALSYGPAKAFGLGYGTLKKGAPADISIIDPTLRWSFSKSEVRSLSFNSPFLDRELTGKAVTVLVGGKVVMLNQQFKESSSKEDRKVYASAR